MRLLFDQNISFRTVNLLAHVFLESKHVRDFEMQFSSDRAIWEFAKSNDFSLVTFDSDFYDMVTLYGHPPKVIWLRMGNTPAVELSKLLVAHSKMILDFLTADEYNQIACLEILN